MAYVYDQYGNRAQQNGPYTMRLTFTNNRNQMDGYRYDAAGNLLNDRSHNYVYDAENRIMQVDPGANGEPPAYAYAYDGDGRRIQKQSNGAVVAEYLHDLSGNTITEINASGAWTRSEIYAAGRHLATYSGGASGTTFFVQQDWLGTERARVLPNGDLSETCTSLPFGDGQTCAGSADPTPTHFTGKERDVESGLDNFGARYYASAMGRFMTTDPRNEGAQATDPQTWNAYSYTGNNPANRIDPDGEDYHICWYGRCTDVSNAEYDAWRKYHKNDIFVNSKGDIYDAWTEQKVGHESWFDGDAARQADNAAGAVGFLFSYTMGEVAGAVGEVGLASLASRVIPPKGIARNALKGGIGESIVAAMLRLKGYRIVARHAYVMTTKGARVVDIVAERAGEYTAFEMKTGAETRSLAQLGKDEALERTGGTFGPSGGELAGRTVKMKTIETNPLPF